MAKPAKFQARPEVAIHSKHSMFLFTSDKLFPGALELPIVRSHEAICSSNRLACMNHTSHVSNDYKPECNRRESTGGSEVNAIEKMQDTRHLASYILFTLKYVDFND